MMHKNEGPAALAGAHGADMKVDTPTSTQPHASGQRRRGISQGECVLCDGQRPQGAIVPRGGKYEAHLADGRQLGAFGTVQEARRAILDADKARRGAA